MALMQLGRSRSFSRAIWFWRWAARRLDAGDKPKVFKS
jgi:hypothetical protein